MPRVRGQKYPHAEGCLCIFHDGKKHKKYAHPKGCQCPWHRKGTGFKPRPLRELLESVARHGRSSRLKQRLVEDGIWEEKCSICGLGPEWNGGLLVLQLDHIDGDRKNWALENLRLVCPNCHAQTPTFCRRLGVA